MSKRKAKFSVKKTVKRVLVFGIFSIAAISFVGVTVFNIVTEIMAKYKEKHTTILKKILTH